MSETIDVVRCARLVGVALTASEAEQFQGQLEKVVAYVDKIMAVDVSNLEPMTHGRQGTAILRHDLPAQAVDYSEAFMCNAPAIHGTEFKLPKVVEEA